MDPITATVLVGAACQEAEHEGRAGEMKVGFTWSTFRTQLSAKANKSKWEQTGR